MTTTYRHHRSWLNLNGDLLSLLFYNTKKYIWATRAHLRYMSFQGVVVQQSVKNTVDSCIVKIAYGKSSASAGSLLPIALLNVWWLKSIFCSTSSLMPIPLCMCLYQYTLACLLLHQRAAKCSVHFSGTSMNICSLNSEYVCCSSFCDYFFVCRNILWISESIKHLFRW